MLDRVFSTPDADSGHCQPTRRHTEHDDIMGRPKWSLVNMTKVLLRDLDPQGGMLEMVKASLKPAWRKKTVYGVAEDEQ